MPENNKLKLLYILEALKKTDENHRMNTNELSSYLLQKGVVAERKSIARDVQSLRDYGYNIVLSDDYRMGYYITDQLFEDYELKIIADAVSGAKFLSTNDSNNIISKLESISCEASAAMLREQTYIDSDLKNENSCVKYNIDKIIEAIKTNRKIVFQYYEINTDGSLKLKRDGHRYCVSPYYLVWVDDSYFLIANSVSHNHLIHFHVEMITNLEIVDEEIRDKSEIEEFTDDFTLSKYLHENVFMYTGKSVKITLKCSQRIAKDLRVRFGDNVVIVPHRDNTFRAIIHAAENEGLYRWIMQFSGEDMKVISPKSLKDAIYERALKILDQYDGD